MADEFVGAHPDLATVRIEGAAGQCLGLAQEGLGPVAARLEGPTLDQVGRAQGYEHVRR